MLLAFSADLRLQNMMKNLINSYRVSSVRYTFWNLHQSLWLGSTVAVLLRKAKAKMLGMKKNKRPEPLHNITTIAVL